MILTRLVILSCIFFFSSGLSNPSIEKNTIRHHLDAAFITALHIKDPLIQQEKMIAIAHGFSKMGEYKTAQLIADNLSSGFSGAGRMRIYAQIALSLSEKDRPNEVLDFVESIEKSSERNYVLEHLGLQLLSQGKVSEAKQQIDGISSEIILSRLSRKLVEFYINENHIEKAEEAIALISNVYEKEYALSSLAIFFAEHGKIDELNNTLLHIKSPEILEDCLSKVAVIVTRFLDPQQGLTFAEGIQENSLFYKTLSNMVVVLGQLSKFESAYEISQEIEDPYYSNKALSELAIELANAGLSNPALTVLGYIDLDRVRQTTLEKVALGLAKNQEHDIAFETVSLITATPQRENTLVKMAAYFGQSANYFYPSLLIKQIQNEALKEKALIAFTQALSLHINKDKALQLISEVNNPKLRQTAYVDIAKNLAKQGDFDNAADIVTRLDSIETKSRTYLSLSEEAIATHNIDLASTFITHSIELSKTLSDTSSQSELYISYAYLFLKMNKQKEAKIYTLKAFKVLLKDEPSDLRNRSLLDCVDVLLAAHYFKDLGQVIVQLDSLSMQVDALLLIPHTTDPKIQKQLLKQEKIVIGEIK